MLEGAGKYVFYDWDAEPDMTGDGSGDPDKYFITIADPEGEEYALIVHRVSENYPLDGVTAREKQARATYICKALNAYEGL